MDPIITKILEGVPYNGMGTTLERNGLIGVIRNLIEQDRYTVDYILNYAESVGYQRQMAEEVFKELTGLSPVLIVNNNEYYKMPAYVPNMCIAWGTSKSNKEKAFYVVPFEYGYAVMEKDEVNAPVPTVISATIPEAIDELKKVAKGIQTLDKIITKKLLETEEVQTVAETPHQVNKPYSASPLQILKKNFKDKVINVSEFERQASKLLASEEITVDEAEDLMAWKQDLIDEDETYGNDVLELDEQWKPLDAWETDEEYEYHNSEAYLDSYEYLYSQLVNGNLDLYREKLNKLTKPQLIEYIEWANEMGIGREELKLNKYVQSSKKVKSSKYYVYDLDNEEQVGKLCNTMEEAEEELCAYAGIDKSELDSYMSSSECQFDIRENNGKKQASSENVDGVKVTTYDHGSRGVAYSAEGLTYEDCGKVYTELCNMYDSVDKSKVVMDEFKDKCHGYFLCKKSASKKQATSKDYAIENGDVINTDDLIFYYADHKKEFMDDYYGDNAAMQSEVDYDFLEKHIDEIFKAWSDELVDNIITDDWEEWEAAEKAYYDVYNKNGFKMNKLSSKKVKSSKIIQVNVYDIDWNLDELDEEDKPNEKLPDFYNNLNIEIDEDAEDYKMTKDDIENTIEDSISEELCNEFGYCPESYTWTYSNKKHASKKVTAETYKDKGWTIEKTKDGYVVKNEKGYIMRTPFNTEEEAEKYINEPVKPNYIKTDGYPIFDGRRKASKKVTAENMDLDDIEAEDNKDTVQEEIDKINEKPVEEVFSETTPEQYFEDALSEDKVDTINEVVSRCIDKFSEKFKDFDKYNVEILSYNTKVLGDYKPTEEEMVEDKELNANAILQVILSITNNADESNMKKALAVFSVANGELHWTGTIRGENDQVVAFTEEGLDALFEVEEPSEDELEDIV